MLTFNSRKKWIQRFGLGCAGCLLLAGVLYTLGPQRPDGDQGASTIAGEALPAPPDMPTPSEVGTLIEALGASGKDADTQSLPPSQRSEPTGHDQSVFGTWDWDAIQSDSYQGSGPLLEQIQQETERIAAEAGLDILERPYLPRLRELYALLEKRGYSREEMYQAFVPLLARHLQVESLEAAQETYNLSLYFERGDREAINEFTSSRLEDNPLDVPALLVRISVAYSGADVEELFDLIEQVLDAVDASSLPEESRLQVLYIVFGLGEWYAYKTEAGVEAAKVSGQAQTSIDLHAVEPLLYELEMAGLW